MARFVSNLDIDSCMFTMTHIHANGPFTRARSHQTPRARGDASCVRSRPRRSRASSSPATRAGWRERDHRGVDVARASAGASTSTSTSTMDDAANDDGTVPESSNNVALRRPAGTRCSHLAPRLRDGATRRRASSALRRSIESVKYFAFPETSSARRTRFERS